MVATRGARKSVVKDEQDVNGVTGFPEDQRVWYTFYSEREQREFYYDPVRDVSTWILPTGARHNPLRNGASLGKDENVEMSDKHAAPVTFCSGFVSLVKVVFFFILLDQIFGTQQLGGFVGNAAGNNTTAIFDGFFDISPKRDSSAVDLKKQEEALKQRLRIQEERKRLEQQEAARKEKERKEKEKRDSEEKERKRLELKEKEMHRIRALQKRREGEDRVKASVGATHPERVVATASEQDRLAREKKEQLEKERREKEERTRARHEKQEEINREHQRRRETARREREAQVLEEERRKHQLSKKEKEEISRKEKEVLDKKRAQQQNVEALAKDIESALKSGEDLMKKIRADASSAGMDLRHGSSGWVATENRKSSPCITPFAYLFSAECRAAGASAPFDVEKLVHEIITE